MYEKQRKKVADNNAYALLYCKWFLEFSGHWHKDTVSITYRLRQFVSTTIAVLFVVSKIWNVVAAMRNDNLTEISAIVSFAVPPISFLAKLICFQASRNTFLAMYKHMHLPIFGDYPNHLHHLMSNSVRRTNLLALIYYLSCVGTVSLFILPCLLGHMKLPFDVPCPLGETRVFELLFQGLALSNAAANNSCLDVLITSLMNIASSQLKILNCKIGNIKTVEQCKNAAKYFSRFALHHNEIIRFITNLEKNLSTIILMQYMTSIVIICNVGFQILHNQDSKVRSVTMVLFLIAMVCQMAMYCWFGNEIILMSLETRQACYESNWVDIDSNARKSLMIIMERSKKPLYLTGGKFFTLSTSSFVSVLNSSYSIFALLQSKAE